MTAESALAGKRARARIDDWLNPIVVKELRQAVQSRFVVAALLVLLSIQLVAIGIYLLVRSAELVEFDAGRQVFLILYGILLGVGMLFVPLYSAVRLVAERSDTNVDLLFITTIKPAEIIAGKLFAATVLAILIFSACLPFMAFTYFLRGIDLPSVFIIFVIGFITVITCSQVAIFVASLPINRVLKVLFGLVTFLIYTMVYSLTIAGSNELIRSGVGSRIGEPEFWGWVVAFLSGCGLVIGLGFVLSVALITPLAANRALPVRAFITGAWALSAVGATIGAYIEKDLDPITIWQVAFNSIFALAFFAGVSERDRLGRRVLRSVPLSRVKRILAFFFFSGGASGLAWASLGISMTLALAWLALKVFSSYGGRGDLIGSAGWMGVMSLYFFSYALSGALLRRHLLKWVGVELTWMLGVILMALGSVVPFMIGYLLFFSDQWTESNYGRWLVGNPFAWGSMSNISLHLGVAAVWAVLVVILNLRWFAERVRGFRPSKQS